MSASLSKASDSHWVWITVFGTLFSGTIATLSAKSLYQTESSGRCTGANDDPTIKERQFAKPYFFTCAMFIGESMCLAYYYIMIKHQQRKAAQAATARGANLQGDAVEPPPYNSAVNNQDPPLLTHSSNNLNEAILPAGGDSSTQEDGQVDGNLKTLKDSKILPPCPKWFFLVLCSFDLTASTLNFVGLLWVSASINQMFRGSMAVFVALFSLCLLRRRLHLIQWIAILVVVGGLVAVGTSSYLKPTDETGETAPPSTFLVFLGIALILAGSALNAFQNVVEELLMKMLQNYREPHPLEIVGWEGIFGTTLSAFVMLPVVYYLPGDDCGGRQEDSIDTLMKLGHPMVLFLVLAYILGLALMNYFSMELSRLLSAVVRNLVSALRTVMVWMFSVIFFYAIGSEYGEQLGIWSVVQLVGFLLLIVGTVLYNKAKERTAGQIDETLTEEEAEEGEAEEEDESDVPASDQGFGVPSKDSDMVPKTHGHKKHPPHPIPSPATSGVHNAVGANPV